MGIRAGWKGVLTYHVGGLAEENPPTTELKNVKDLSMPLEKITSDVTTRATQGWEALAGVLKRAPISWSMLWKPGDAGFDAMLSAWANDDVVAFMCLDQAFADGGKGFKGDFEVIKFEQSQNVGEAMMVNVEISLTDSDTPPSLVNI